MDKVEFFSFRDAPESLRQEWRSATNRVIESGYFIGGPEVEQFESEWAKYLGVGHAIGVGNGYDAIVVGLKILGVGKGDFVAVPNHTFVATWLAVGAVGATPIGIDCDSSGLMDLNELEENQSNFSAVLPVHMHGQMVDMPRLVKWAALKNVKIIEDCAQAHGAQINGKLAGTWGHFGAFSFYPTKNLGALGDAGSLVTDDATLASNARSYVNYGSVPGNKYQYQFHGINSRLDPIQAALLSVNLKYLDLWNSRRREIASTYSNTFEKVGIRTLPIVRDSVFHHYIVLSENRDATRKLLEKVGIKTEIHYPETAELSFKKFNLSLTKQPETNASTLANKTLSIPISPWMSEADVLNVTKTLTSDEVLESLNSKIR